MKSLFAAIILFTRLPLWRIVRVDKKQYAEILLYWPIVGFLTGATTWGTLYLASWVMPLLPACVIAVIARLLLTGALHEDGLADFFDGFGGGHDKAGILRIMKDSHIGSYGTIGLILYFILYVSLLSSAKSTLAPQQSPVYPPILRLKYQRKPVRIRRVGIKAKKGVAISQRAVRQGRATRTNSQRRILR